MTEQSLPHLNQHEAICFLCRYQVDTSDNTLIRGVLSNGLQVYAHALCAEAIKTILETQGGVMPKTVVLAGLARAFKGEWILTRRQFPNQYVPILAYFYLNRNEPRSAVELAQWLARNGVDFSNPAVPIRRLGDRSSLSVIVSEDGMKRYLLTSTGEAELMRYLDELRLEDGE